MGLGGTPNRDPADRPNLGDSLDLGEGLLARAQNPEGVGIGRLSALVATADAAPVRMRPRWSACMIDSSNPVLPSKSGT